MLTGNVANYQVRLILHAANALGHEGDSCGQGADCAAHADPRVCPVMDDSAFEAVTACERAQWRYDQSGNAAGWHGIDPDDRAPDCAAMFFQGTLGSFMAYSQIGDSAAATTECGWASTRHLYTNCSFEAGFCQSGNQ